MLRVLFGQNLRTMSWYGVRSDMQAQANRPVAVRCSLSTFEGRNVWQDLRMGLNPLLAQKHRYGT